jgi:hypothetical protein
VERSGLKTLDLGENVLSGEEQIRNLRFRKMFIWRGVD